MASADLQRGAGGQQGVALGQPAVHQLHRVSAHVGPEEGDLGLQGPAAARAGRDPEVEHLLVLQEDVPVGGRARRLRPPPRVQGLKPPLELLPQRHGATAQTHHPGLHYI